MYISGQMLEIIFVVFQDFRNLPCLVRKSKKWSAQISDSWIPFTVFYKNHRFYWTKTRLGSGLYSFFNSFLFRPCRANYIHFLYIRWVSVVEFHDQALSIGKVFGQESTVVKWNYQILSLHLVTVCQKVPIIQIFLKKNHWRISI